MRSFFTAFLLSSLFLLSGCNDDNDSDKGAVKPPEPTQPGCKIHCAP